DCLQDNFMVYLEACNKFDTKHGSSFNSYLYNLLKWTYIEKLKKQNNMPKTISMDDDTYGKELLEQITHPEINITTPIVYLRYIGYTMPEI
ncbi:hypothetical protein KQH42_30405, partial [Streptomyces sp. CHA1]|uniref:hypothetical protein n=1 Tax=Streptomyces sp. CHA1 TaxID=2841663 RepID=UPI0020947377